MSGFEIERNTIGAETLPARTDSKPADAEFARELRSNVTEPDDPDRLALELEDRVVRAFVPTAAVAGRTLGPIEVARERKHHHHGVLGDGDPPEAALIDDENPSRGRGVDIDVVVAETRGRDDLEVRRSIEKLSGYFLRIAHP